jgi:L-arabinokinase
MTLVAYVSGHGLGHSTREIEILRHLPTNIPLVVKTAAPEWFWRAELQRPFEFVSARFDVGCIQKNGLEIDIPATLNAWKDVEEQNRRCFQDEVNDLQRRNTVLVVSDVPSFPLSVATAVGIPSVCVANFTWADIYQSFVAEEPTFHPIVSRLTEEYQQATLHLDAGFSLPMPYFHRKEQIGLVARSGKSQRDRLLSLIPVEARKKRIALVYVSGWGLPIAYEKVGGIADWYFVSLDAPQVLPANWTVLDRALMPHPDFVASVDAVLSKPGYGIAGECVRAGTPLIYPPRETFAEYAPLHQELLPWEGGLNIPLVLNYKI